MPNKIDELLHKALELNGSDLHLSAKTPPAVRVHGKLEMLRHDRLTDGDLEELILPILTPRQQDVLREKNSVDMAYTLNEDYRFRVNIYFQRGSLSGVFRQLPNLKLSLEALGLPASIGDFAGLRDGLVLVTGPTGSGKSTTLAAIIDQVNRTDHFHIITIEDPIEFVHENKRSIVSQRELFTDVPSFASALRDSLREDPDVILVGEMRDLETMRTAIMAAETGHLVFSTLHSRDAISTLNRMISVFPTDEQPQVRYQLATTLKGVVSQRLLPTSDGAGRCAAIEIMCSTTAISNLIRTNRLEQVYSLMETGGELGMQTMELSLIRLYKDGKIDMETALRMAKSENLIKSRLERENGRKK
jgi:twitching motility protein PilT